MEDYKVEILEHSGLSARDRLAMKDTSTLDLLSDKIGETLTYEGYMIIKVHNPYNEGDSEKEVDYHSMIMKCTEGVFYTSSKSFKNSFKSLLDSFPEILEEEPDAVLQFTVVEKKSNNNQGSMLLARMV